MFEIAGEAFGLSQVAAMLVLLARTVTDTATILMHLTTMDTTEIAAGMWAIAAATLEGITVGTSLLLQPRDRSDHAMERTLAGLALHFQ